MSTLEVGNVSYSLEEAQLVLLGYAFGVEERRWSHPGGYPFAPLEHRMFPVFAYASYDCICASPGRALSVTDVLLVDGLNGRLNAGALSGALAVLEGVNRHLEAIPDEIDFMTFGANELTTRACKAADPDSPLGHFVGAWWELTGAPGIGLARSHKILHHKRPTLFPLLDSVTTARLGSEKWAAIRGDLEQPSLHDLASWFDGEAHRRGRVSLSVLRVHDILLWCGGPEDASRQRAHRVGQAVVEENASRS